MNPATAHPRIDTVYNLLYNDQKYTNSVLYQYVCYLLLYMEQIQSA